MITVKADKLTKQFPETTALEDVSFSIEEGEIFGLVGPDGAGKTTCMRILSSIMEPTSGEAHVCGFHHLREAETIKEHIGYMSQKFGLYPDLTVQENLDFYADLYGVPSRERSERYERVLTFSNLHPFTHRQSGRLSGGMKQKLALACALVHTPRVLFLDEPTNGVDPVSRRDFWRILSQLKQDRVTIVVSTAYLDEAERCTRLGLLNKGKLLALGTPDQIRSLLSGTMIEIRSPMARKASQMLKQYFPAESVTLLGDRIHLISENPDMAISLTKRLMDEKQMVRQSIRTIPASLEDVFVSFLTRPEGGATHV